MSDVIQLTVCDSNGKIDTTENGNPIIVNNAEISSGNPNFYAFYAIKIGESEKKTVLLTMPVGGNQNGLLRLPRVGERILAIQADDNAYYLLSYIPDTDALDFRKEVATSDDKKENTAVNNQALTLRYKSPNPLPVDSTTKKDNICSELNFSTKETFWFNQSGSELVDVELISNGEWKDDLGNIYNEEFVIKNKDNKKEGVALRLPVPVTKKGTVWKDADNNTYDDKMVKNKNADKSEGTIYRTETDKIDRIDLTSTGDILTTAGSYNEVNARRIAIFANQDADDIQKTRGQIQQGNIQCSAKNYLMLNAGKGVIINCGRSMVKIDDTGITLISAKVDPNKTVGNDSTIQISSRSGVNIVGSNVNLKATSSFKIAEGCGGMISSIAGITRISALDVEIASQSEIQAGIIAAQSISNYVTTGIAYDDAEDVSNYRTTISPIFKNSLSAFKDTLGLYKKSKKHSATKKEEKDKKEGEQEVTEASATDISHDEETDPIEQNDESTNNKGFKNNSKAACVCVTDLVLSLGNMLLDTSSFVFGLLEGKYDLTTLNKASHWAEQGIIDSMLTTCAIADISALGKKCRSATSSIRFHGGYGDIECSTIKEMGVEKIEGCSPTAATGMAVAKAVFSTVSTIEDIVDMGIGFSSTSATANQELNTL